MFLLAMVFFNNSNIILGQNSDFRYNFKSYISSNINIKPIIRKKYFKHYNGIDITELNKSLRLLLSKDSQILFEIYNKDGIFYISKSKNGFDFAYLDKTYNLMQLWNLCFGKKHLHNGENHWTKIIKIMNFLI